MSNKTPKENERKTKSALRALHIPLLVFLVVAAGLTVFSLNSEPKQLTSEDNQSSQVQPDCAQIGTECIKFETADSNQERIKGLSGRDSLAPATGMLFVFDKTEEQCIWMKDMKFSVDIIWLSEEKKILNIAGEIGPETYPRTYCAEGTKYVVELNAGTASRAGLQQGQTLNL